MAITQYFQRALAAAAKDTRRRPWEDFLKDIRTTPKCSVTKDKLNGSPAVLEIGSTRHFGLQPSMNMARDTGTLINKNKIASAKLPEKGI